MKRFIVLMSILSAHFSLLAQDDLLNSLESEAKEPNAPVFATFKSTRIINGQSVENVAAKHLDFRISHRFGKISDGAYQLWGLDQANVRLIFDFGITDKFMVGVSRSSVRKTFDIYGKYKLLSQSTGENGMPITLSLFTSATAQTLNNSDVKLTLANRMAYTSQLLIARKFNERLSLQISPTFIHTNLVELASEKNNLYTVGFGGRTKITKRTSLNAEYFPRFGTNPKKYRESFSLGFDIETGGHVFQLHVTNSRNMIDNQFIGETTDLWEKGQLFYGFNISRVFSLGK